MSRIDAPQVSTLRMCDEDQQMLTSGLNTSKWLNIQNVLILFDEAVCEKHLLWSLSLKWPADGGGKEGIKIKGTVNLKIKVQK